MYFSAILKKNRSVIKDITYSVWSNKQVKITKAEKEVYAAIIDDKVAMKIGPGHYEPGDHNKWKVAAEGRDYKVWETSWD